jgi:hypothetical protein
VDVSGGGAAWNVAAFRRGGDARSIPRIRISGEHTRDRNVRALTAHASTRFVAVQFRCGVKLLIFSELHSFDCY